MEIRASESEMRVAQDPWVRVSAQLNAALATGATDSELRTVVRKWCDEARTKRLPPERFLVLVKEQLSAMPTLRQPMADTQSIRAMERVVRLCIDEYFSSEPSSL